MVAFPIDVVDRSLAEVSQSLEPMRSRPERVHASRVRLVRIMFRSCMVASS